MYIDECETKLKSGKTSRRALLRESYRDDNGKVCKRTLGNLSSCSREQIEAVKLALKHKGNLNKLFNAKEDTAIKQGLSVGCVYPLVQIADRLGITKALGHTKEGKRALWQVISTVISPGSRMHTVRMAKKHAGCELIGLETLSEDDLYNNLDYLAENKDKIEKRLFEKRNKGENPILFLYDVTSSYLEGQKNHFGEYGYNRDGKKGKKQIVVGLLTDENGEPVSVSIYPGNTSDSSTFSEQIEKVKEEYGISEVAMVGDRGMIKSAGMEKLKEEGLNYITAITKPQIRKLIKEKKIKMSLFDSELSEIEIKEKGEYERYILRRNPIRQKQIEKNRESRIKKLRECAAKKTEYLKNHERAKEETAQRNLREKALELKIDDIVEIRVEKRKVEIEMNEEKLAEKSRLDGCYVIKTDIAKYSAQMIHGRYKDLSKVERGFRTMKTGALEIRPMYVRTEKHTIGKVFITMLAYMIERELERCWYEMEETVSESLEGLKSLCVNEVEIKGVSFNKIPEPTRHNKELLRKLKVKLPEQIPWKKANVVTKRKSK